MAIFPQKSVLRQAPGNKDECKKRAEKERFQLFSNVMFQTRLVILFQHIHALAKDRNRLENQESHVKYSNNSLHNMVANQIPYSMSGHYFLSNYSDILSQICIRDTIILCSIFRITKKHNIFKI